jgi:hypothetical protein
MVSPEYFIEELKTELKHLQFRRKDLKRKLRNSHKGNTRNNILKYEARIFEVRKLLYIFSKTIEIKKED